MFDLGLQHLLKLGKRSDVPGHRHTFAPVRGGNSDDAEERVLIFHWMIALDDVVAKACANDAQGFGSGEGLRMPLFGHAAGTLLGSSFEEEFLVCIGANDTVHHVAAWWERYGSNDRC